jgi:hypothetical protein
LWCQGQWRPVWIPLFWGSVLGGFAVAFGPAFLVNRALIRRGKGCALAHCGH